MIQIISKEIVDNILVSEKLLREAIEKYKGKQVIISIDEFNPKKSSQKRKQYFAGIVEPMRQFLGYESKDALHEELKLACNPVTKVNLQTGEEVEVGGSTKKFSPDQWEEYKTRCRRLARRLGIKLLTESEYYNRISNSESEQKPFGE
ncbi:MAG: hypothetical protein PHS33_09075 [Candidatus Omnitrophica bacterium]|jgi:hypothetical protein|nr:hypothetical protein [Candidatus Omnitrophota bacterium]